MKNLNQKLVDSFLFKNRVKRRFANNIWANIGPYAKANIWNGVWKIMNSNIKYKIYNNICDNSFKHLNASSQVLKTIQLQIKKQTQNN